MIGPNELGKHPELIKRAQQELLKMDILVCGACHAIFHIVASFEEHKENCKGTLTKQKPDLKTNWAFLLWKSAQANVSAPNNWKLYQKWATLDTRQQQAWISAGQAIQTISRLGHGSVQETQVKVMRTVTGAVKTEGEQPVKQEPEPTDSSQDVPKIKAEQKNPYQKVDNSTNPPTLINRYMVKRTMNTSPTHIEVRECLAEKVLSRRMNSKRNTYEYLVKFSDHDNSWEPKSHFEKAAELLAECDRKLAKAKGLAAQAQASTATSPVVLSSPAAAAAAAAAVAVGRPARGSKARAVDTLKQWCNTTEGAATAQAGGGDLKRKITDSDAGEAEESSQDESSFGMSPSPKKLLKTSPQIVQKMVGGTVRYYQKTVNGAVTAATNLSNALVQSAEIVIDKLGDKASGVRRKPGMVVTPMLRREAQVKVVGKNETTSSGIVRLGKGGAAGAVAAHPVLGSPPPSPVISPRMQKVVQTTRTPDGQVVKRTVYRTMPATTPVPAGKPSPTLATKPGITPRGLTQTPTRPPLHTYQVNKQQMTQRNNTPQPVKVSPRAVPTTVRTPVGRPVTTTKASPVNRVVRSSPVAVATTPSPVVNQRQQQILKQQQATAVMSTKAATVVSQAAIAANAAESEEENAEMILCPVTGQLVNAKTGAAGDDSELQRLLTNEEEEAEAAAQAQQSANTHQIHELIQNEDGSPVIITGDDGTVYQVAGKNAEGQTLLVTQGEDGEQQCVIMASPEEAAGHNMQQAESGGDQDGNNSQAMLNADGDSQDGQITAELVQADEPSADGTRRVVLLLPDGNLMVSEVNEEQYQQFNLGA